MTLASKYSWFNGCICERETGAPSVASISFHLGTGVFDGLVAYWNGDHYYLHRAEEHLIRFHHGAAKMALHMKWTVDDLLVGIKELLRHEPERTQYVRPIVYRAAPELWVTGSEGRPVDVSIFTVAIDRDIDSSLRCHLSPVERISSRAIPRQTKVSGAYVNSFYARKLAEEAGFQDGIMLDREGRIAEASAANFFAIVDDELITPPLNPDVFPGITRSVIMEIAKESGIACIERDLYREDMKSLDAAFLCSTLMEIRAISSLGDRTMDSAQHPVFRSVVERFRRLTHQ